jgi:hypothetical protein
MKDLILLASLTLAFVTPVFAQQNSGLAPQANNAPDVGAMQQQIKDLQERLIALEGQVRMLKTAAAAPAPPSNATPGAVPQAQPPGPAPSEAQPGLGAAGAVTQTQIYGGAGGAAAKALNPDISVIGDFICAAGNGAIPALASQSAIPLWH